MSSILESVRALAGRGEVQGSVHGYRELADEGLFFGDILASLDTAVVIEEYPDYHKGPCVLVLQRSVRNQPVHALWGIARGKSSPAVLITAYIPKPELWSADFMKRRTA